MFKSLSKDELKVVIQAMEEVIVESGDPIIKEGEQGNVLYVVAQGQHDCSKVINGKETYLKTYKPGEIFGELALMYNAPRAASIKAKTKGKLFSLDRQTFNNLVQEAALNKRKNYMDILSKVEILTEMDPNEKDKLCDTLFEENYGANQFVVRQGESGDRFYIVADGQLHAEKLIEGEFEPKKVFEYKAGDYFGEIALLKNTVRQASIVTDSPARIVSVQRDAFKRLLGPIENILQRNMQKYKKYCAD